MSSAGVFLLLMASSSFTATVAPGTDATPHEWEGRGGEGQERGGEGEGQGTEVMVGESVVTAQATYTSH